MRPGMRYHLSVSAWPRETQKEGGNLASLKKPSIAQLLRVTDKYRDNLYNKNILLVGTRGDEVGHVELRFLGRNFKHLTGVKTVSRKLRGNQFWRMCANHRISERDLEFDYKGTARQKLNAAERAFEPGTCFRGFGVPNGARRYVEVELFAGSLRACMGFENFEARYLDPKTLLDSPIDHEVLRRDMFKVVGVYSKPIPRPAFESALFVDDEADWGLISESLPEDLHHVVGLEKTPV